MNAPEANRSSAATTYTAEDLAIGLSVAAAENAILTSGVAPPRPGAKR